MENKTDIGQNGEKDSEKTSQVKITDSVANMAKVYIKTSSMWEFLYEYLDVIRLIGAKYDRGFYRRYGQLMDYVYNRIALPDCKILDEYHVYEVIMNDGKTENKDDE